MDRNVGLWIDHKQAFAIWHEDGKVEVIMDMNNAGRRIWGEMTTQNVGKPVAIVLDNIVQTAPNVNTPITDGTSAISGNYTQQDATDLAKILEIGKLPAPAKIVQEQQVGPTLGQKSAGRGCQSIYYFLHRNLPPDAGVL